MELFVQNDYLIQNPLFLLQNEVTQNDEKITIAHFAQKASQAKVSQANNGINEKPF
jgi:hypothetical protein